VIEATVESVAVEEGRAEFLEGAGTNGAGCGQRQKAERTREALLVGRAPTLMWAVPHLLNRCGFHVDVVSSSPLLRASQFVRDVMLLPEADGLSATAYARICDRERPYDWVIACDDQTLLEMSKMDWPAGREPAYLPLQGGPAGPHIYSKIGLSRVLRAAGVRTPQFRVARSCAEASRATRKLGYPVLLKTDSDSGGAGVHLCRGVEDVWALERHFVSGPMLVQKRIEGREVDLSGFFFEGRLIHFCCAEVERMAGGGSLSAVRRYYPLRLVEKRVFTELSALGRALGANGFVSIGSIEAADGSGLYFFEADMRPTVWVDAGRLYGDDAAKRIRGWFERGEVASWEEMRAAGDEQPVRVAHFQRLAMWEMLVNRYGVWRTVPWAEWRMVAQILAARVWAPASRKLAPRSVRRVVKRWMVAMRVAFP